MDVARIRHDTNCRGNSSNGLPSFTHIVSVTYCRVAYDKTLVVNFLVIKRRYKIAVIGSSRDIPRVSFLILPFSFLVKYRVIPRDTQTYFKSLENTF